ncbi:MAG: hypothetical protein KGL12_03275 [Rhodospirillales bacterium]|nr:hypothetical protein [Rhodospirillales bacterium]
MTHPHPILPRLRPSTLLGLAALALSACSVPLSDAQRQTVAACRERADQVYEAQNRGAIYLPHPSSDTPFSSNYAIGGSDSGLIARHADDQMVTDCVRNTGTQPMGDGTKAPPAPGGAAK